MAKILLDIGNGVVVLSEEGGNFTLTINAEAQLGGGKASGIISAKDAGSVTLHGKQVFDLGMAILEAHSPAPVVPLEQAVQAIADNAIDQQ